MKWRSKYISMVFAKVASRNVAFKVAKMQLCASAVITHEVSEVGSSVDEEVLGYLGPNADLHISNQC